MPGEVVVAVAAVVGTVVHRVIDFVAVAAVVAEAVAVAVAAALGVLGVVEVEAFGDVFAALVVVSAVVSEFDYFVSVGVVLLGCVVVRWWCGVVLAVPRSTYRPHPCIF